MTSIESATAQTSETKQDLPAGGPALPPSEDQISLRDAVDSALGNYFRQLKGIDGLQVADVYDMVLSEVEPPLLEQTLRYCGNNQTRAAQILGLNRGTLRKKLKRYGLL